MANDTGDQDGQVLAEQQRLDESRDRTKHWKRWGPYVSERAWGTVREDYSPHGTAWEFFPHDQARSKAYRWGEDGLAGICDNHQRLCFALGLWNGADPILKERLFGLTGNEGNHGEDVKEYYFYLDCTPTHSYMKYLYKYPQRAYPYRDLIETNRAVGRGAPEYELLETGIFDEDRYFDIFVEYAKADVEDLIIRIKAVNRGPEAAPLYLLPTIWFRNTWQDAPDATKPGLEAISPVQGSVAIECQHQTLGTRWLYLNGAPKLVFTENETNWQRIAQRPNTSHYVKDGIDRYLIHGDQNAINQGQVGTKAAGIYPLEIGPGQEAVVDLRLSDYLARENPLDTDQINAILAQRTGEADDFYAQIAGQELSAEARSVQRQALAGMLWTKQFFHYDVSAWLARGDKGQPRPSNSRPRNANWSHLYNEDIISMPDKWEYPWYASWDLAFHCIPLALVDVDYAKEQLILFLREWYMHPNGQIPAYEWAFDDVNPPVHAWAVWRVYKIEGRLRGKTDRAFLQRAFHKLLLNFTWWVNRKDASGRNIFEGGFLGLDNIGVFDRSAPLPTGGRIEQSDGTSWMGMFCLNMLAIALELAKEDRAYSDIASKFFEHFVYISHAINNVGDNMALWDEEDGFFYDALCFPDGQHMQLKVRSMVGLISLFAVETLEPDLVDALPGFKRRMLWFVENRPHLRHHISCRTRADEPERRLLAIVGRERLRRVLKPMLDENEFLSPYGIRALSRFHKDNPYVFQAEGKEYRVDYEPAESSTGMFGGNSNWRGPIWFPVNYLLIESLQKFHFYYGDDYKIECPTGSGQMLSLWEVASELSRRLCRLFLPDKDGQRPIYGGQVPFQQDPNWREHILFYEYFHGDNGAGIGASHQTGWTGLVAKLLQQSGAGL